MSIPHGMCTECAQNAHRHCSPPLYSVRICAHSVRMRTTTIFCAQCAQPLRTDILCCAHSVRMLTDVCAQRTDTSCAHSVRIAHRRLWKFYPLSVRSAPTAHRCAPLVHPPLSPIQFWWVRAITKAWFPPAEKK